MKTLSPFATMTLLECREIFGKPKGKPDGKVGWAYGRLATVGIWPKNRRIAKQLATVQQLFYSTKSNT